MLSKTHLAITLFFILIFLNSAPQKLIFIAAAIIATYVPDIDSSKSRLGRVALFKPLQWFVSHRGVFHSFTFLILIGTFFYFFIPIIFLGFVLGYASHLVVDAATIEGVRLFYPLKGKISGFIKTGGFGEKIICGLFSVADAILIFKILRI